MITDHNELKKYKSVAIMGGTFDPIHYGHLVTAEAVRHKFGIDYVVFMPTGDPAHKSKRYITPSEHRYLMAVLATVTNKDFGVSRLEIDRPGKTYTVDTIDELKKICPDTKLYFITGADAVHDIFTWKDAERLVTLCDFIAVTRPGYKRQTLFEEVDEIRDKYAGKVHFLQVPALAISSTDIRARVMNNAPIKYLLPEGVEEYIYKHGLYKGDDFDA